jgi:hypothetical protein
MSFVNLVVLGFIGEYTCLFVLRTAISEEAKGRGGIISGELGTLPDVSGHGVDVTLPEVGGDGETDPLLEAGDDDRTRLPMEASGGEVKMIGTSLEAGTNGTNGTNGPNDELDERFPGVRGDRAKDLIGTPAEMWVSSMASKLSSGQEEFTAARLRTEDTEHGKILVVRTSSTTKRFKLVDRDDCDDDALTFYVDSIMNQPISEHQDQDVEVDCNSWLYVIFFIMTLILPLVFIFLLTGFHKRRSTTAQRAWMMTWLVYNQLASTNGIVGSLTNVTIFGGAVNKFQVVGIAGLLFLMGVLYSIPAIGGFVMVGKMLIEFGSCSLTP